MKSKLLIILFIASILSACTTSYKLVSSPKQENIIEAKGSKDELYVKANQWMVRTFKDAKSVIQFQDKEEGKIMGKYLLHTTNLNFEDADVFALITISVKDNATKIEIEPLGTWNYDESGFTLYKYSPQNAESDMKLLFEDYQKFMKAETMTW